MQISSAPISFLYLTKYIAHFFFYTSTYALQIYRMIDNEPQYDPSIIFETIE